MGPESVLGRTGLVSGDGAMRSFIHSFIQRVFTKHLLSAWHVYQVRG